MPVRPNIAIALGDPAGIGPEIALKAALDPAVTAICRPVLFGDPGVVQIHAERCGLTPQLRVIERATAAGSDAAVAIVGLTQFAPGELRLGEINAANGRAAVVAARRAIEAALAGEVSAVIAAPQTEAAIHAAGIEFDGYPSFVARTTGTPADAAYLMICFDDKRIVHTTLHVSLRRALELVTRERVQHVIRSTDHALRRIGIDRPRIAVAGLNPHASEGGLFGAEEATIITPATAAERAAGIDVAGPFGADTMFAKPGFDAFIVMFHDQGHIAAKTLAPNRTAGMTIGTPIVFSSVAHGSALDIAGCNRASPAAIIEAVRRVTGVRG